MRITTEGWILVLLVLAGIVWSWIGATDRLTWWLEALPVVIGLSLLLLTAKTFPLTPLLYRIIALHMLFLLVGAHYTYALTPPGLWLQELLGLARNPYDRIGHVLQGITPALLTVEILARRGVVASHRWQVFFALSVALAFSALYELLEWGSAMAFGAAAEHFLAMQGDIWDTQWDMLMALLGAGAALALFSGRQRRQIETVQPRGQP